MPVDIDHNGMSTTWHGNYQHLPARDPLVGDGDWPTTIGTTHEHAHPLPHCAPRPKLEVGQLTRCKLQNLSSLKKCAGVGTGTRRGSRSGRRLHRGHSEHL